MASYRISSRAELTPTWLNIAWLRFACCPLLPSQLGGPPSGTAGLPSDQVPCAPGVCAPPAAGTACSWHQLPGGPRQPELSHHAVPVESAGVAGNTPRPVTSAAVVLSKQCCKGRH
jgi:hypothetical protein